MHVLLQGKGAVGLHSSGLVLEDSDGTLSHFFYSQNILVVSAVLVPAARLANQGALLQRPRQHETLNLLDVSVKAVEY